jgi:hypothetical protein
MQRTLPYPRSSGHRSSDDLLLPQRKQHGVFRSDDGLTGRHMRCGWRLRNTVTQCRTGFHHDCRLARTVICVKRIKC